MANDSLASAKVKAADTTGENVARPRASDDVFSDVQLSVPKTAGDFLQQSQKIRSTAFSSPEVVQRFKDVERTGDKAAQALDIIDQDYIDAELDKLPLDKMQAEVDDLQASRTRVLPDILADTSIKDFRSKVRIAGKIQAMFDSQVSKILARKKELEQKAENRGKRKVDELKAKANVINKEFETDKFLLSETMARVESGEASLQDMLEFAAKMQERAAKASKDSKDNPFVGAPSRGMIQLFKVYEATFPALPLNSTASAQEGAQFRQAYDDWVAGGRQGEFETEIMPPGFIGPPNQVEVGGSFAPLAKKKEDEKADLMRLLLGG